MTTFRQKLVGIVLAVAVPVVAAPAEDWPMYRCDAYRSSSTKQQLPDRLHLRWVRELPKRHSAMDYDRRMEHDNGYQPIVVGKTMFVGMEYNNCLLALDTDTGADRWRYYLEGPVRYAPAAWEGRVYVAPEDGRLVCLDARTGRHNWTYEGAPSPRKIFNHERLTSNWPASSGPAAHFGMVYYGTGVWPVDGTFAHAVGATTGERLWRRRAHVIWGYATCIRNFAVIPSGKYPNVYDVSNGKPLRNALYDVKNLPTALTAGFDETHLFNGNKAYALERGEPTYKTYANAEHGVGIWTPVIDGDRAYGFNDGILKACRKPTAEELKEMGRRAALVPFGGQWYVNSRPDFQWSRDVGKPIPLPAGADLPKDWYPRRMEMKAGERLYASGPGAVIAIDNFGEGKTPRVSWIGKADSRVTSALAADGKLFITCESGKIFCYGGQPGGAKVIAWPEASAAPPADAATNAAKAILDATKITEGYCYVWHLTDGRLAEELKRQSSLRVIAIDPAAAKVGALRKKLDSAGILDRRLVLMVGDPQTFELPPYTASLIVSENPAACVKAGQAFAQEAFRCLRPYGGAACLALSDADSARFAAWAEAAKLPGAAVGRAGELTLLKRSGALPGAADWPHDRATPGNTVCSADAAIQPPLGLLWFGGPAAEWSRFIIGGGGSPQTHAQGGRYIIQGHGLLSCLDCYTGRLLWEKPIPKVVVYFSYIEQDLVFKDGRPVYPEVGTPLWNGGHSCIVPGEVPAEKQSGAGFNMTALPEGLLIGIGEELWQIDLDTGQTRRKLPVPIEDAQAKRPLCWGAVRAADDDVLIATAFDPADMKAVFYPAWHTGSEKNKQRMPMRWLMALDRRSGRLLWKHRAVSGYLNWGLCAGNGRVYALDLHHPDVIKACKLSKWKMSTGTPALAAFDLRTGRELWRQERKMLSLEPVYSAQRDILVLPQRGRSHWKDGEWQEETRPASAGGARRLTTPGLSDMWAYRGKDGTLLWHVDDGWYAEPLVLNGDILITRRGTGYELLTGKEAKRQDPITGGMIPWQVSAGGCNFLIGSRYLTTHRICYDDVRYGYAVPLRGMRSACTPSIIPACGVLSVLNQTGNYPSDELRSAYVLTHRPQHANATSFGAGIERFISAGAAARRLGLNFAAASDLMGLDGTPWLAHGLPAPPGADSRGRPIPAPPSLIKVTPDAEVKTFSLHPAEVQSGEGAWAPVAASGFVGARRIDVSVVPGAGQDAKPIAYTVRLYFLEPKDTKKGRRVFSVRVQGIEAVKGLDVVKAAGGPRRALVRQLKGVQVAGVLSIELLPVGDCLPPVICGVEVSSEPPEQSAP